MVKISRLTSLHVRMVSNNISCGFATKTYVVVLIRSASNKYRYFLWRNHKNINMFSLKIDLSRPEVRSFVCVEVLRPSQPNGVMSSAASLPNHTFTGQA